MTLTAEPSLAELQRDRADAERAYRAAQRRLADGAKGAAEDVRDRREALQMLDDRIQGVQDNQRRADEAAAERAAQAQRVARNKAADLACTQLHQSGEIAARISETIRALAADLDALKASDEKALSIVRPHMATSDSGRLREAFLRPGFLDHDELIVRELAAAGIPMRDCNRLTAINLVEQRNFLRWTRQKISDARETINHIVRATGDPGEVS